MTKMKKQKKRKLYLLHHDHTVSFTKKSIAELIVSDKLAGIDYVLIPHNLNQFNLRCS